MDRVARLQVAENALHLSYNGKLHITSDITYIQKVLLNNIKYLVFFAGTFYYVGSLFNGAIDSLYITVRPSYYSQLIILLNFALDYQYFSTFT